MKTLWVVLVCALSCPGVWAQSQSTAQIQGTIQDATGSAVPGAEVKITQTDTGALRSVPSGADGGYVFPNLPVGPYRLEVSKQGFSTYVQTGIVLQVATNPTIDVALRVGAVSEQVQVEANAALVDTQTTGVGAVIENQRILELPLNGRQATDLIGLAGAAIPQGVAGAGGFPNTGQIVIAGGQAFGVAFWLDGSLYNNPWDNANLPFPFPDALQEFKVETSSLTAQNGLHSGGSVNSVTKSGTNSFHGDLFEFLRNGDLNGRNFLAPARDNLKRNQYGGTIGGPIKKDKLFFFGGYQGTKTRQSVTAPDAFVPTAQMLTGDFTGCPSFASMGKIDPTRFDPASVKLASKLPAPIDSCGRVRFGFQTKIDEYQIVGKVDYQLGDRQSLFGRYVATNYVRPPAYALAPENVLTSTQGALDDTAQSVILGDTYLIGPTIINSFRVAMNRVSVHRYNADFFSACELGVKMYCGYVPHQSYFTVPNSFSVGFPTIDEANSHSTTYQLGDDVSIVRGSHQFGFGATLSRYTMVLYANVYAQGLFTFPNLPAFLLGQASLPNSITVSTPNNLDQKKWYFGTYAQDTWKATPRLTVNLGLRYEPYLPPEMVNGAIYNFSYANFLAGKKTTVYKNSPAGFTFPGDPGFPSQAGTNKQWGLLAPRVGLAWDPTGSGKMSIRASYGLAYDFANGQLFVNTSNGLRLATSKSSPASSAILMPAIPAETSTPIRLVPTRRFLPTARSSPCSPT